MRQVLIPCTSTAWDAEAEQAKAMDRECVLKYGQRDRDLHLCSVQRSQQRRGYLMAQIETNIYGFCVRDTMNDGLGNMSGNGSAEWVLQWAREWHAQAPGHRVVLLGFVDADRMPELLRAQEPKIGKSPCPRP